MKPLSSFSLDIQLLADLGIRSASHWYSSGVIYNGQCLLSSGTILTHKQYQRLLWGLCRQDLVIRRRRATRGKTKGGYFTSSTFYHITPKGRECLKGLGLD